VQGGVTGLRLNHTKFFEISGTLHTIIHFVCTKWIIVWRIPVFLF